MKYTPAPKSVFCELYLFISHRIHGAGIYANIGGILMVNVTIQCGAPVNDSEVGSKNSNFTMVYGMYNIV